MLPLILRVNFFYWMFDSEMVQNQGVIDLCWVQQGDGSTREVLNSNKIAWWTNSGLQLLYFVWWVRQSETQLLSWSHPFSFQFPLAGWQRTCDYTYNIRTNKRSPARFSLFHKKLKHHCLDNTYYLTLVAKIYIYVLCH